MRGLRLFSSALKPGPMSSSSPSFPSKETMAALLRSQKQAQDAQSSSSQPPSISNDHPQSSSDNERDLSSKSAIASALRFHGTGLAQKHRRPETMSQWHKDLSEFVMKKFMASKNTRPSVVAKKMYCHLDTLDYEVLKFFYGRACELPPSFQSWFSITQLHVWMCQTRLRTSSDESKRILACLTDHFTSDMETKIWNSGVTNVRVYDKALHELLSLHYGCVLAYDEGYESSDAILASAVWRNVFTMRPVDPRHLCNVVLYVRHAMEQLHASPEEIFMNGKFRVPKSGVLLE